MTRIHVVGFFFGTAGRWRLTWTSVAQLSTLQAALLLYFLIAALSAAGAFEPANMGREPFKSPKVLALELSAKRDLISEEMEAILSVLTAPGRPGLTGNLVDAEGFPRADIDIVNVRTQRHRLAVLRTDYKAASRALEAALEAALPPLQNGAAEGEEEEAVTSGAGPAVRFAEPSATPAPAAAPANGGGGAASAAGPPRGSASDRARTPFAVVDSVSPGSPAADAEIHVGDRIAAFGAVSMRALHSAAATMQALPATVRSHVNRPLDVIVHRGPRASFECIVLSITPRTWSGTGLLGCHVLPLRAEEDEHYRPDVATAVARR